MAARRQLLIGLFPPANVRAGILAHRADWWWPRGCTMPPAGRLHLTLCYLPDHQGEAEQRLRATLACVPMPPLDLTLDSSGTWRNDVSVVCPAAHDGLREFHDALMRALRQTGFISYAGSWTPHVTIARKTERAACPAHLPPIQWAAREFRLVRSHFTHPFRHELLDAYPAC
ncbi:RNA 2',3'-cyclic phosphodiesterase [Acidovorax cavernicola]|uniref:RNA 2',3'-cyclic phosphodiesterase n=1 Tax=Acidovorax cavernicola TaxID=1675792 RepID=A0A9X8GTV4_9BURK|nr:RNA 2',3'-cyclic phosphodiesterase [Acidovorax cavernicola]